jgi:hypothetical protein
MTLLLLQKHSNSQTHTLSKIFSLRNTASNYTVILHILSILLSSVLYLANKNVHTRNQQLFLFLVEKKMIEHTKVLLTRFRRYGGFFVTTRAKKQNF